MKMMQTLHRKFCLTKNLVSPAFPALVLALCASLPARADIYEWAYFDPKDRTLGKYESDKVTPGGSGLDAGEYFYPGKVNLTKGYFEGFDLTSAYFNGTTLVQADFDNATLTSAVFYGANVINATFDGADITGASLGGAKGFTKEQLYSTASYKNSDLSGIWLSGSNLTGWDFTGQNLSNAYLSSTNVSKAIFTNADITGANLYSAKGFTKAQMISTASWQNKDLTGVSLQKANLKDWDFTGQNIAGANLSEVKNFTKEQFYSTKSYESGNLTGAKLYSNNLTGWNFAGKDLTSADFYKSKLLNANFAGANLTSAIFWYAPVTNTDFTGANLKKAGFHNAKLGNATFTGANLAAAGFYNTKLDKVNFTNANLMEAFFDSKAKLSNVTLDYADSRSATNTIWKGHYGTSEPMVFKTTGKNFIKPDGKVAGFDLASGQTMRIWDCNPQYGATPLNIVINKHFTMAEGSTLRMVFEDAEWGSLIETGTSDVSIAVVLAGTLELGLADGVTPTAIGGDGTAIRLFDWTNASSVTGEFTAISLTGDYQGFTWDTSSLYTDGTITLVEPAVQSVAVQRSESLPMLQDPGTFTAVPEPGTLALAGFAGGALTLGWFRRRSLRKG